MIFRYRNANATAEFGPDDVDLNQRRVKIQQLIGASDSRVQAVPITSWAPGANPTEPFYLGAVLFFGIPSAILSDGIYTVDANELRINPEALLRGMVKDAGLILPFDVANWKFEDPDDVVPPSEDPIGEAWPDHPLAYQGRKFFHTSEAFSIEQWPMGTIDKPQSINRPEGRYTLFGWQTGGSGLPGQVVGPSNMKYAWEKDYSR